MSEHYFQKVVGIELTVQDLIRFVVSNFETKYQAYGKQVETLMQEFFKENDGFIHEGHYSSCECGCQEMTVSERKADMAWRHIDDEARLNILSEVVGHSLGQFQIITLHWNVNEKILVGCTKLLRFQTDDEYDEYPDGDSIPSLVEKVRQEFASTSVSLENVNIDLLSTFGTVKESVVYDSIYS